MVELKVYRDRRNGEDDVKRVISSVWNREEDVISRKCIGAVGLSAESISDAFLLTQEAQGGSLNVKIHCCEIGFSKDISQEMITNVTEQIQQCLGSDFQNIAVTYGTEENFYSQFVINAVSYQNGKKFQDNNNAYIRFAELIKNSCGKGVNLKFGDSVLYKNENNNWDNYVALKWTEANRR